MAINWSNTDRSDWNATTVTSGGDVIKGEMITAQKVVSSFDFSGNMDVKQVESIIKKELMNQLVEYMFNNKYILFTKMTDQVTLDNKYYARIFVVPDEQVRILRDYKVK
jgi:hypothetical protein